LGNQHRPWFEKGFCRQPPEPVAGALGPGICLSPQSSTHRHSPFRSAELLSLDHRTTAMQGFVVKCAICSMHTTKSCLIVGQHMCRHRMAVYMSGKVNSSCCAVLSMFQAITSPVTGCQQRLPASETIMAACTQLSHKRHDEADHHAHLAVYSRRGLHHPCGASKTDPAKQPSNMQVHGPPPSCCSSPTCASFTCCVR
jgi:hypothetical protein